MLQSKVVETHGIRLIFGDEYVEKKQFIETHAMRLYGRENKMNDDHNDFVDLDLTETIAEVSENEESGATLEVVFGKRLKEAREAQKLAIEDVADRLYLAKEIICAIEADEYYDQVDSVFVCGHIRGYARLLAIPDEEVDAVFHQLGFQTKRSQAKPQRFTIQEPILKDKTTRLVSYVVIAVLTGLLLTWYLSHRNRVDASTLQTTSADTQQALNQDNTINNNDQPNSSDMLDANEVLKTPAKKNPVTQDQTKDTVTNSVASTRKIVKTPVQSPDQNLEKQKTQTNKDKTDHYLGLPWLNK